MDFNSLIHVAQKNEKREKNDIKYYSTKFEAPKKEERSKQLSRNIQRFLARKEAEEKEKAKEAKVKKNELLALRSQDKKATRRVSVMLKRTKSANKSVIEDAVDNDNTAVTLAGPSQPDEDDYGYVSQEASAFYSKMMAKYSTMPDEPKIFSSLKKNTNVNLNGTKDRVRAALLKEQEDALLPHRRKRKSKHEESEPEPIKNTENSNSQSGDSGEKPAKPKPKPMGPPPLNFQELLKLAEKKQFEPIKIEPKKKSEDEEYPMTKKQRREAEAEKAWLKQREERRKAMENDKNPNAKPNAGSTNRIPKLNDNPKTVSSLPRPKDTDKSNSLIKSSKLRAELEKPKDANKSKSNPSVNYHTSSINKEKQYKKQSEENKNVPKKDMLTNSKKPVSNKLNKLDLKTDFAPPKSKSDLRKPGPSEPRLKQLQSDRPKQFPPSDVRPKSADGRPRQFPPSDVRPKQFPPSDVRPKQFPPPDVRSKQFPPGDIRRRPVKKSLVANKRRILDDDDSEYDSEMDDFIDDDDAGEDYSKYISEIFGYDKNKYRDVPEDDDRMESSFSQMMREEYMSSKIGMMEDLEDMKQEAIDKKKKAARMKR